MLSAVFFFVLFFFCCIENCGDLPGCEETRTFSHECLFLTLRTVLLDVTEGTGSQKKHCFFAIFLIVHSNKNGKNITVEPQAGYVSDMIIS